MKLRLLLGLLCIGMLCGWSMGADALEQGFDVPPVKARPHTWWHWMNGNITREGITGDLEAMARAGLGGAQIFNVGDEGSVDIPTGKIMYLSPEWLDLVHHAVKEAQRVGIELCFHNCAGWSSSGGPWITPELSMQRVVWTETEVTPETGTIKLAQPQARLNYYRDIAVLAFPTPKNKSFRIKNAGSKAGFDSPYGLQPQIEEVPSDAVIAKDSILNLLDKISASGQLNWKVPSGSWTILRIGHTTTGKTNHPAPTSGLGLECDKLSREALDVHWNKGVQPVLDKLGSLAGKVLNNVLVDSYEVGPNNWTPKMRAEFQQRRGYDLMQFLPTLTGRVVTSSAVTERFLWDYRRTFADLFADNYYGYFADKCHERGLLCSVEPYDGPFECAAVGAKADIVMGEFWIGGGMNHTLKLAASVAHTHGMTYVGAESFTSTPDMGRWQNHPGSMKMLGDKVWCMGINRYIFHRYAHQPWLHVLPGMTMGQWGTHFERTNTWWEPGKAWMRYIGRSQFLLQQGHFAADVLFFVGEAAPNGSVDDGELRAAGYDFDMCGTDLIDKLTVDKGMIALPDGMRYRLLVLPQTHFMTPKLAETIRDLVSDGAIVLAPKPELSPSLVGYPACDDAVKKIADEVWGSSNQGTAGEKTFGKGRIIWGRKPLQTLRQMDVAADCIASDAKAPITFIHRTTKDADIYFISHQDDSSRMAEVFFRVTGRQPELWNPITGEITPAGLWRADSQGTRVTLPLGPAGSVFVVFRKSVSPDKATVAGLQQDTPVTIAQLLPRPVQKLEILEALYGVASCDGEDMVDVTAQLAKRIQDNKLDVMASNSLAGDPVPDVVKKLYVEYEYDGKAARAEIGENQRLVLPPAGSPAGRPLRILMAGYGVLPKGQTWLPERKVIDVTAKTAAAVKDNVLKIRATNDFAGKDPAYMVPKRMMVRYTLNGEPGALYFSENSEVVLPPQHWQPAAWMPELTAKNKTVDMVAWDNGQYVLGTSTGNKKTVTMDSLPKPIMLDRPWTVEFTPGWNAPARIEFPTLISWTQHTDPGVKHYSGTAIYRTTLNLPSDFVSSADRIRLDLGEVCVMAEVIVNGHNLGVLWCNPYRVNITDVAKAGDNTLEIRVTNLWVNRLIGDEQYPDDCQWKGKPLKAWPDWFVEGKARPTPQRLTFTTWKHWTKDDPLLPSGLLGPVYVRAGQQTEIDPAK
ncbi:MAG: hypothetical protein JXB18_07860 [Sedimentisphaerales bacterium]|nr:hypothetical protein [Sedimentisphaerales bacterium]